MKKIRVNLSERIGFIWYFLVITVGALVFSDQQVSNIGKHNIFNGHSPVLCFWKHALENKH